MAKGFLLLLFVVSTLLGCSVGVPLPGLHPNTYKPSDKLVVQAVKMTSNRAQYPKDYYSLKFCEPEDLNREPENLGEILLGDRVENTPYIVKTDLAAVNCKSVCTIRATVDDLANFADAIEEEYRVHWLLDGLPSAVKKASLSPSGRPIDIYQAGFSLGKHPPPDKDKAEDDGKKLSVVLHNHVVMTILWHKPDNEEGIRIVGFEIDAQSIAHTSKGNDSCSMATQNPLYIPRPAKDPMNITFSYSVQWMRSDIKWAYRWDTYLKMVDTQIHWFSIVNSLMIVVFLTGMVAMIMMRTLRADLRRYNQMDAQELEEAREEYGWKLVHGDVFRVPQRPMLLAVCVGSGVQIFCMLLVTMVFAILGFLSPANRGALMTAMVSLFVLMGVFAGYSSARLYKSFHGQKWHKCTLLTAIAFPGVVFIIFALFEILLVAVGSSGAVPIGYFFALILMWFGVSVPLVFLGAYFGYRRPLTEPPVRTNQIPRQIPVQVWYMHPVCAVLMGGILPFGAVFIELFFIMTSIWLHQFYYMFGFLFIVFLVLVVTCAEISIVLCYFQLCSEDYNWWWRGFLTSGISGVYMMVYSVFYFFTRLNVNQVVSAMLFFGYSFIMSLSFGLLTGCIGFYACLWFVRTIYSYIKVD